MSRLSLLSAALALVTTAAAADPGYYVVTAYDNAGLRTADFRYWTFKPNGQGEIIWPEVGFAYGVSSRWTTELLLSWIGSSQMSTQLSTVNWQNEVLLTQGEWPVDVALHLQYIDDRIYRGRRAIEFGPVLQTDVGRTQLNANVFFERGLGAEKDDPTTMKYQWQLRYRWTPPLHFGLQGFGELGPWNAWAPGNGQSHRAGPAVFTTARLDDRVAFKLQAAWLVGRTGTRSGHMFTLRATSEF